MAYAVEHGFFDTVYYAHPVSLYNTPQEERDIKLLQEMGMTVINPNSLCCEMGYKQHGMEFFDNLLDECDLLIFRAFPDGSIPSGVQYEISYMRDQNKPVLEIPNAIIKRSLSVEETRETLREIGNR